MLNRLLWQPRLSAGVLAAFVVASAMLLVNNGLADRPLIAIIPLPAAIAVRIVRQYPKIVAALVPCVAIYIDGLLIHFGRQTPVRLGSAVVGLLLWAALLSPKSLNSQTGFVAGWIAVLLILNYFTLTLPGTRFDIRQLALLLEAFVLCTVVSAIAPSPTLVLKAVIACGLLLSVFAFRPEYYTGGRPVALGLDTNYISFLLAAAAIAVATLYRVQGNWRILLLAVPLVAGMIETQSRAGAIAGAVGLAGVATLSTDHRRSMLGMATIGVFVAGMALAGVSPGFGVFTSRRNDTEASTKVREEILQLNLQAVRDEPLRGVGLGNTNLRALESGDFAEGAVSHNEYLRLAAESGLPALVAFLALIFIPIAVGAFTSVRRSTVAILWPITASAAVAQLTFNALDNAQMAAVIMTLVGTGWSGLGDLRAERIAATRTTRAANSGRVRRTPRASIADGQPT